MARCTQFRERCTSGKPLGGERSYERGIGRYAKTDAIHDAVVFDLRTRQHIHIGVHAGYDVLDLGLAENSLMAHPGAGVDQCEYLLAGVRVGSLRYRQVGSPGRRRGA